MTKTEAQNTQEETVREKQMSEADRQYVDAYRRIPVTDEEMALAWRSAREYVTEEPW